MTLTAPVTRKRSALTKGQLPGYAPYVVLAVALVLGAAILALIGFNVLSWGVVSAILFTVGLVSWSGAVEGARKAKDKLATCLVVGAFLVALLPLVSVIWTVLVNGIPGIITPGFLGTSMNGITGTLDNKSVDEGTRVLGGVYHALLGTVQITLLATVISVPVGLLTAIYLVEYGNDRPLARAITFFVDVMTGIPSIVAGLFAAAFFFALVGPGTKTGAVAAVALSVLMIPVVVRSSEEMLKIVPNELREASYALGVRKWRTILKVVIPTAISGIASGVTLAIARVIGETAPILVTAGFATSINNNVFGGWMASLPTFIYTQILNPTSPSNPGPSDQRAWGAALVLIILVMLLNLAARLIARIFAPKAGR
ncbi:phosphate ABC transporter permease PstA [Arthrobacter cupressi]|uniref:Phosphate transport system permease protein PstA n=1 Tax=Arthrobacter cupressi TaxID=1045773 RepID=A0A1G8NJH3_9MICC|nr:phosphate ABC transporter permease PstA [Arthrobacter cupressi]NYD78221.1 phosphate transport system permease protein [Arthrobacter cupressi]SDI80305.1 phosphate ABC transporter membrane protein 2, PhoT family [Arthrobacter cupressi]